MAGALEEFKVQAVAKAERDAAAQDAQNKAADAARRAELIAFADDFETARLAPLSPTCRPRRFSLNRQPEL